MFTNREITLSAYQAVLSHDLNWLLLRYSGDNADELDLYSYGSNGLEELKSALHNLEDVAVAFYRHQVEGSPAFLLITHIPTSTSPVRKARALVHSRRVGTVFHVHHTMLTVDSPSHLTTAAVRKAIFAPDSPTTPSSPPLRSPPVIGSSLSSDSPRSRTHHHKPKPISLEFARRSFSETYVPHYPVPQPTPPVPSMPSTLRNTKASGMFGGLLRPRKKRNDLFYATYDDANDLPPPIPPKDNIISPHRRYPSDKRESPPPLLLYQSKMQQSPAGSLSEFGAIARTHDREDTGPPPPPKYQKSDLTLDQWRSLPLRGKWARDVAPSDPKEREARRRAAQRQREVEEKEAIEEEKWRQEEKRRQKQEEKERDEEEEVERRLRLEEEMRYIAAEKERKRRLDEEEEARKRLEIEDRKKADREKRSEEHRRLERWRREREKEAEGEARRAKEVRENEEAERRRKIQQAEKLVAQAKSKESPVTTGWITIQFHDSLFWKRRFYRFTGGVLHLHRSPKDLHTTLETVELRGKVSGLKEWNDGYEELEAIPFSFVVEFKDDRQAWSMYADSEQDKFRFLGLVHHAAGL